MIDDKFLKERKSKEELLEIALETLEEASCKFAMFVEYFKRHATHGN